MKTLKIIKEFSHCSFQKKSLEKCKKIAHTQLYIILYIIIHK